jgi:predicted transposase/invertase (TIGR01784 family)
MKGPRGHINPLNDYAFMKALGEKGADKSLRNLINAVLKEAKQPTIKWLNITPRHFTNSDIKGGKNCILDVFANADHGKIDVEVQICNNKNLHKRLLFYWAKLFTAKFKEGENYQILPNVAIFAILDYTIEDDDQGTDFLSHIQLQNVKNGKKFSDDLNLYIIEMPKFRRFLHKNLNNTLHQWLTFLDQNTKQNIINNLINMNTNIKTAHDKIQHAFQDDDAYSLYVSRQIAHWDYVNGIQDAREEGLEKGERKKEIKMILRLHNIGLSMEHIAEAAERSVHEVIDIINKYKQREKTFAV